VSRQPYDEPLPFDEDEMDEIDWDALDGVDLFAGSDREDDE
jgi:hypothetical protein